MDIRRGPTKEEFQSLFLRVNRDQYDWNLTLTQCEQVTPTVLRFKLRVRDHDGPGNRRSWSGRRTTAACWHAWRDVLAALFDQHPNAVVTGGFHWRVTYRGKAGFEYLYPRTAHVNVGSEMQPVSMPDLCECDSDEGFDQSFPCNFGRACLHGCQPSVGQLTETCAHGRYECNVCVLANTDTQAAIDAIDQEFYGAGSNGDFRSDKEIFNLA